MAAPRVRRNRKPILMEDFHLQQGDPGRLRVRYIFYPH